MIAVTLWAAAALAAPRELPIRTTAYWDLALRFSAGKVSALRLAPGRFPSPTVLPRHVGRFVVWLCEGATAKESVAFDFPLVADAETDDVSPEAREFARKLAQNVTAETVVRLPQTAQLDGLAIEDTRGGGEVLRLSLLAPSGPVVPAAGGRCQPPRPKPVPRRPSKPARP